MKKVIGALLGASAAFSLVVAGVATPAQAATVDELKAQVQELLAKIAQVEGVSSVGAFNVDLKMGSTGADVVKLQTWLESKGLLTIPAGVAKGYFGPATQAAVSNYQKSVGITPTAGYFGPMTRAKVNAGMSSSKPSATSTSDQGFVASFSGDEEATIKSWEQQDPSNDRIEEGSKNAQLSTFNFDVQDSKVKLRSVDVTLTGDKSFETKPWQSFDNISIWYKGKKVADAAADDENAWDKDGSSWVLKITGVNTVLNEGDQEFEVRGDVQKGLNNIDSGDQPWTISSQANFLSPNGATTEEHSGSANFNLSKEGGSAQLDVSLASSNPDASTIEVNKDSNSSEENMLALNVKAKDGSTKINKVQFVVDIRNTDGTAASTSYFSKVVSELWIVGPGGLRQTYGSSSDMGQVTSGSYTVSRTAVEFDLQDKNNEVQLSDGEKATLEVHARFKALNNFGDHGGKKVTISARSADIDEWDVESGRNSLSTSDLQGSATGQEHGLLDQGITAQVVSVDGKEVATNNDGKTIKTDFTVKVAVSAFGDTFFVPFGASSTGAATTGAIFDVEDPNTNDTKSNFGTDNVVSETMSSTAKQEGNYYRIDSGSTETFTVHIQLTSGATATPMLGAHRMQLKSFNYVNDADPAVTVTGFQLAPAEDYQTPDATLDA